MSLSPLPGELRNIGSGPMAPHNVWETHTLKNISKGGVYREIVGKQHTEPRQKKKGQGQDCLTHSTPQ